MEIVIDLADPKAPFAQLIEQIKQAVASGQLDPGAQLPSIRQLAGDLNLNSKTVAKAYRLLERDSAIQSRGYRGTMLQSLDNVRRAGFKLDGDVSVGGPKSDGIGDQA